MAMALVVYREPGWFAGELRRTFGMKALGVTNEDVRRIIGDADFRARTEKTPLSAADRSVLRSALIGEACASILRWYEPGRGFAVRTYANCVMNVQQPHRVAIILEEQANEQAILDAPLDEGDPLSPAFVDKEPDESCTLKHCLHPCDWEMVVSFFTQMEFQIFEARLHNVSREAIRRELGMTPGVWRRVWRNFQRRAAFILDLSTPTPKTYSHSYAH